MFQLLAFQDVRSPRIRQFDAYWRSKIGAADIPPRSVIDPLDLKPLLPYMIVVDIEAAPFRVLYRLAGTRVVEMNGIELTGRYLDTLDEGDGANFTQEGIAAYHQAWSTRQPVYGAYHWPTPSGKQYRVEFAIFPVSEPGVDGKCIAFDDWDIDQQRTATREPPVPYVKTTPTRK
jgi:hypothetical protein